MSDRTFNRHSAKKKQQRCALLASISYVVTHSLSTRLIEDSKYQMVERNYACIKFRISVSIIALVIDPLLCAVYKFKQL